LELDDKISDPNEALKTDAKETVQNNKIGDPHQEVSSDIYKSSGIDVEFLTDLRMEESIDKEDQEIKESIVKESMFTEQMKNGYESTNDGKRTNEEKKPFEIKKESKELEKYKDLKENSSSRLTQNTHPQASTTNKTIDTTHPDKNSRLSGLPDGEKANSSKSGNDFDHQLP